MIAHGWRRATYTATRGGGKVGSANAPTGTAIMIGIESLSQYTIAPHVGQKRNVAVLPSSPVRWYSCARPSIVTRSAGQRAWMPNALPVRF